MNSYKQPGEVIEWTNDTGDDVAVDSLVKINDRVGVACVDIADGATGSVQVWGVVEVAKLSTDVVTQGVSLYLDNTNHRVTLTTDGPGSDVNILAGYAWSGSGNGATTVELKLNG